jgi:hypothetical protein
MASTASPFCFWLALWLAFGKEKGFSGYSVGLDGEGTMTRKVMPWKIHGTPGSKLWGPRQSHHAGVVWIAPVVTMVSLPCRVKNFQKFYEQRTPAPKAYK